MLSHSKVKRHLRITLCFIVLFSVVAALSLFQLNKVANFHRLNTLHLKHVNDLNQSLFGENIKFTSRNYLIKTVKEIREQPVQCLKQINIFDRWFIHSIGAQRVISLCQDDIALADKVLLKLQSTKSDIFIRDLTLLQYIRNASVEFSRHSKEFELHTTELVDKIIEFFFGIFMMVSTILILLSITIYRFVISFAKEIEEKNDALTEVEMENWRMAFFDQLTGLPNRNLFNDRLGEAIKNASRNNTKFALMFLDLDRFKYVNDTYGHAMGDKLIYEAAVRFSSHLRESDTLARFGGDEFVLILENLRSQEDAAKVANKIIASASKEFFIDGISLAVTTSIGIAIFPRDGLDAVTLLKNADIAMYTSKSLGKSQYCFHDEKIKEKANRLSRIENRLKLVVKEESLSVVYQPIVDFNTGYIKGVEVLLRWHDRKLGNVSPEEFIPVAEDSGQIIEIGQWVYEKACKKIVEWRDLYQQKIYMSVNVSGRQLKDKNFVQFIQNTLQKYNLPASAINLEITENVFYTDSKRSIQTIKELKKLGIILLLDDFGTGYSSLSTLTSLPFDFVKIDKSFLMHAREKDLITANTIIDMAKNFNMGVIAEGIEHVSTVEYLMERDCEFGQGYLFSKPCAEQDIDFSKDYTSLARKKGDEETVITFSKTA